MEKPGSRHLPGKLLQVWHQSLHAWARPAVSCPGHQGCSAGGVRMQEAAEAKEQAEKAKDMAVAKLWASQKKAADRRSEIDELRARRCGLCIGSCPAPHPALR